MIKVTGLKKHFGDLEVLKGIDQHIKQGEKVVVIGPSGSGKSTFLRCLNLLEVPTEGEILIEGESITAPKTNVNKIREKMGMVFQQFNLFPHLTVLDNITLAPIKVKKMQKAEAEKLARELVEQRKHEQKEEQFKQFQKVTLDNLFSSINEGELKELNIIVKADVQGSVEAVRQSLEKLSNDEVKVKVIHGGVGAVKRIRRYACRGFKCDYSRL